jgi:fucose permease
MSRRLLLALLALASVGGALWVLVAAARADALSGQVFFAVLPLAMLFGLAWRGLRGKRD